MELNNFSWQTFSQTGDIDAYLLYKSVTELKETKDKEQEWQASEPKESL